MRQSSNKDILFEEIKSWEHFEYALREVTKNMIKDKIDALKNLLS